MLDLGIKGYSDFEALNGARIIRQGSDYWRMVGPGFWRPLLPFLGSERQPIFPAFFYLGGLQFPVANREKSNSYMHYYAFDNPSSYNPDTLPRKSRQAITHAKKFMKIVDFHEVNTFNEESYPVYLAFYSRTNYKYLASRIYKPQYAQWCASLFDSGKLTIMGAYFGNTMAGLMVMGRVNDVAIIISTFSHSDYLQFGPTDLLYDEARTRIAACPDIRMIYLGGIVAEAGINRFKEKRGASLISVPSRYYLNPALKFPLKYIFKDKYHKILGDYSPRNSH